jgi:hypothetical protein
LQIKHTGDRDELASVTRTMLASALGITGAGLINEETGLTRTAATTSVAATVCIVSRSQKTDTRRKNKAVMLCEQIAKDGLAP